MGREAQPRRPHCEKGRTPAATHPGPLPFREGNQVAHAAAGTRPLPVSPYRLLGGLVSITSRITSPCLRHPAHPGIGEAAHLLRSRRQRLHVLAVRDGGMTPLRWVAAALAAPASPAAADDRRRTAGGSFGRCRLRLRHQGPARRARGRRPWPPARDRGRRRGSGNGGPIGAAPMSRSGARPMRWARAAR